MVHVGQKSLLFLMLSVSFLTGCEDPAVSVSTLGRKLAAPVLTSTSPFDQDMNTNKYVRVQGTCDPRVGPLLLSFDNSVWHSIPSSPNTTGTTLATGTTNDVDCSDGKFDAYLTETDLINTWGIYPNDASTDVNYIYIKGETWFGDTRVLTLVDPKANSDMPAKVSLKEVFPMGYAGNNQCAMFSAVVLDSNYNETTARTAISFQLANNTGSGIDPYTSASDCASSYNPQSTLTIPASSSNLLFYVKMPSTPVDSAIEFSLTNLSSLTTTGAATSVMLRDPTSAHRFISMDSVSTIYKDTCYPLNFRRMDYYNTTPSFTSSVSLTMTSSASNAQLFTASDCNTSSKTSTVTFSSYSSQTTVYVKYASAGTSSNVQFTSFNLTGTASDTNYDVPSFFLRVDVSSNTAVSKIDMWGPNQLSRNVCMSYTVATVNSNWTSVPADKDYDLTLLSSNSGPMLQFYSDEGCYTSIGSTVTVTQGQVGTKVWVKGTGSANAGGNLLLSGTGFNMVSRAYTYSVTAQTYVLGMASPYYITKDQCTYIELTYYDQTGSPLESSSVLNLAFASLSGDGSLIHIYSDSACASTAYGENTYMTTPPYSSTSYKFYIKVDGAYSTSSLSLFITGNGSFNLPTMNHTFTIQ